MRDDYVLTFLVPNILLLRVPEGRHSPCLAGCALRVDRGVVKIEGPSRERVCDQAERFFRAYAKKIPPLVCSAILETPREAPGGPGRDDYTITVNATVSIKPDRGGVEPRLYGTPQLTILSAG